MAIMIKEHTINDRTSHRQVLALSHRLRDHSAVSPSLLREFQISVNFEKLWLVPIEAQVEHRGDQIHLIVLRLDLLLVVEKLSVKVECETWVESSLSLIVGGKTPDREGLCCLDCELHV